jgi:prophage regulatory protein
MTVERVLRWPEVYEKVGLCKSQIYSLISQGKFPPPIKLGARASGWLSSEVSAWLENKISSSRSQEAK